MGKASFQVGQTAYIDGRDLDAQPPLTVGTINLWQGVPRKKTVGQLDHGTRVTVMAAQFDQGRWYYCVRHWGRRGWVSEPFLGQRREASIGDVVAKR